MAGSVAADIAALGAIPYCVGVVGTGAEGESLRELLRRAGAEPGGLVGVNDRPTTRKTRLIGLAQHRHRQQLIRVDDEATTEVRGRGLAEMVRQVERLIEGCQVACVEDYNKGVVSAELVAAVRRAAERRGIPVFVDPAAIADYGRYCGATLVTPNRSETEKVAGLPLRDVGAVERAAGQIVAACRTEYVCVTLDAEGAALLGPGGSFRHVPTRPREVYDVTGAGDAVLATLSVAAAAGAELCEAVALATVAGGLEVEKFGCVPIRREEILGEILLENHRTLGKVRTLDQLLPELTRRRQRRETVAFTNGCFDLLHRGHVSNLAFCKQQANMLVVGLNSDVSVRRLDKGKGRPIVGQADRAAVLAALGDVDYIVIFDDETPQALIEAIQPDVLVKGADWRDKRVVGQEIVERRGGKVLLAPLVEGASTSKLIERIRGAAQTD